VKLLRSFLLVAFDWGSRQAGKEGWPVVHGHILAEARDLAGVAHHRDCLRIVDPLAGLEGPWGDLWDPSVGLGDPSEVFPSACCRGALLAFRWVGIHVHLGEGMIASDSEGVFVAVAEEVDHQLGDLAEQGRCLLMGLSRLGH
jgi:hypothetical protein